MSTRKTTRRRFLSQVAVASAAGGVTSLALGRRRTIQPQNVRVAVAGLRGRGGGLTDWFRRTPGVEIVALCDPDQQILQRAAAKCEQHGESVKTVQDVRRVLDDPSIDAVVIATPNHWHALMTIWACQAGKHVYVEKPVSHTMWEGQQMIAAVRQSQRVVQGGMQARSATCIPEALAWLREGNLGDIQLARGICYKPRRSIGKVDQPQAVPEHINYDLWTGPAPLVPLRRANLHYDWHWDTATGNGDLGNQGVHQMDVCRWLAGHNTLPASTISVGGRLGYLDDGNTPNTQLVLLDYEEVPILFEVRGLPQDHEAQHDGWNSKMDRYLGHSIGVVLHCEGGTARIGHNPNAVVMYDEQGQEVHRFTGGGDHVKNFIEAVQANDPRLLNCPIDQGVRSADLCHLAQISHQLGEAGATPKLQGLYGQTAANEAIERMSEHIRANAIDTEGTPIVIGRRIETRNNQVIGDAQAAALVQRSDRAPYVVPALTA